MIVCWFGLEVGCLGVLLFGLFDLIILVCFGENCGIALWLVFIDIAFWVSYGFGLRLVFRWDFGGLCLVAGSLCWFVAQLLFACCLWLLILSVGVCLLAW